MNAFEFQRVTLTICFSHSKSHAPQKIRLILNIPGTYKYTHNFIWKTCGTNSETTLAIVTFF